MSSSYENERLRDPSKPAGWYNHLRTLPCYGSQYVKGNEKWRRWRRLCYKQTAPCMMQYRYTPCDDDRVIVSRLFITPIIGHLQHHYHRASLINDPTFVILKLYSYTQLLHDTCPRI